MNDENVTYFHSFQFEYVPIEVKKFIGTKIQKQISIEYKYTIR